MNDAARLVLSKRIEDIDNEVDWKRDQISQAESVVTGFTSDVEHLLKVRAELLEALGES